MVQETRPAFRVLTVVRTLCKLHVTLLLHFIYFLGASLLTTKKHFALHLTSLLTTCAKFPPCSCYPLLACAYKSASTVRTDLLQEVEHQKKIALYDGTALMHGLHLGLDFQNRIAETVPDRGLNRDMRDYIEHEKELEVAVHIAEAIILKDNLRRNCSRTLRDLNIQKDAPRSTNIGKGKGRGGRDASQKATIGKGEGMGGRDASQKAKEIISEASKRVITLLTDEDFVSKKYATRFQEQGRKSLLPGQPRQRTTASFQETPCYGPTTIAKDAEKYLRPIFEAVRNKMPGCTFFTRLPHKSLYTRAGVNPGGSLTSQFPAEPRTHGIITADAYDIKVLARMVSTRL